jgi:hypothetical protein
MMTMMANIAMIMIATISRVHEDATDVMDMMGAEAATISLVAGMARAESTVDMAMVTIIEQQCQNNLAHDLMSISAMEIAVTTGACIDWICRS